MGWWNRQPVPPPALVPGDMIDIKSLSPNVVSILKLCLGKLDKAELEHRDREQVEKLYTMLPGDTSYTLLAKGQFGHYGAPVEFIKALPPNPRRK